MIQGLLDVDHNTPLPVMRAKLGGVLGLDGPVPMPVLLRALEDPGFASDLITCRSAPAFLAALFDDKRTRAYAPAAAAAETAPTSTVALAGKAAQALARWARSGFSTVDADVLERRETACLGCPNLAEPDSLLQKMVPTDAASDRVGSRLGRKVCKLCGCVASKKIRLPTEACPGPHPARAGVTRWDEPIAASAAANA
jgi:hypothetical protein